MEVVKVEGIIIKDMPYLESGKILTLLTKDYGILCVLAKGCRSSRSKLRGVTGKLTYGEFYLLYKKTGLSILTGVDVLNPFRHILMDIEKISYASYLLELSEQVFKEADSSFVFSLLADTLIKIEEGFSPLIMTNILELKYLNFLGVALNLNGCVTCGSTKNIQTVSVSAGGYICSNCYQGEKIYSEKFIQLLRMFYLVDISKISKLEIHEDLEKELNQFIDEYYEQYTGLYLQSKQFLKNLKKVG